MENDQDCDYRMGVVEISMAFPRTSMRREMMCRRFEILHLAVNSGDIDNIEMTLGDFLMEARSLHDVIGNEGADMDGFASWWTTRKEQLASNPLMKWAHDARIKRFHHGIPSIEITGMRVKGGTISDHDQTDEPRSLVVNNTGAFWYSHPGTRDERIARASVIGGEVTLGIRLSGLSMGEGAPQTLQDLLRACDNIGGDNRDLVHEVKSRFPGAGPVDTTAST